MAPDQIMQRTSDIAYASSAATITGGAWAWLGANSTAIGALCLIIGAVIGIVTCWMNWHYKRKYFELDRRRLK